IPSASIRFTKLCTNWASIGNTLDLRAGFFRCTSRAVRCAPAARLGWAGRRSALRRLFWLDDQPSERVVLRYKWCRAEECLLPYDDADGGSGDPAPAAAALEALWRDLTSFAWSQRSRLIWLTDRALDSLSDCLFAAPLPPGHPAGCPASEITRHRLDRSWALAELLRHSGRQFTAEDKTFDNIGAAAIADNDDDEDSEALLLAELQLSFVLAVTLHNSACLDRWLGLLNHLCRVREALLSKRRLFVNLLRCLLPQLIALSSSGAESSEPAPVGLRALLIDLWQNCSIAAKEDSSGSVRLGEIAGPLDAIQALAGRLWGWRLDCEEDEDAADVDADA
uniref:UDENN domain-containing protein n=1 Tax=Macrostomum lignano TaxID=282301 RepID=A0A1I8FJD2_9PLAT